MFQDIDPHKLDITFTPEEPKPEDVVLIYENGKALFAEENGLLRLPTYKRAAEILPQVEKLTYLLKVDGLSFFLHLGRADEVDNYKMRPVSRFRRLKPEHLTFGAVTAAHLGHWYESNRLCGRCGKELVPRKDERALFCPVCAQVLYPRISPVIIVAVTDGDRLLLTRYSDSHSPNVYHRHALIAGFVEIGETLEDTVRREVMEEVGLKVKNLIYYASQPWGFSDSVLMGFFADLDGSPEIHIDENELSEGVWMKREEIPHEDTNLSLTWTMIDAFRRGEYPARGGC